MVSCRYCAVFILAIAVSLGATTAADAQESSLTIQTTPGGQRPNAPASYVDGYTVTCTAAAWVEGEWSPYLYAYNWLYVDSSEVDYAQDFGFWYVVAVTEDYVAVTPYNQYISCYADFLGGSQMVDATVPGVPTGETIQSGGWSDVYQLWQQTLTPGNYSNRWVTEQDGGGGSDTCWYWGSPIPPFTSITGGDWQVGSSNDYGPDWHGWGTDAVAHYRSEGRAPCQTDFYQNMLIDMPGGSTLYQVNPMSAGITDLTVWCAKGDQFEQRTRLSPSPSPTPHARPQGFADRSSVLMPRRGMVSRH